eukprot:TRINITY_DN1162_c0_g1_i1.p1 TRINITY_DN1162_c0_g1~~TRINITY_DN1162_c0_g1_i1.p1  ORF type:complete len:996 (+),score=386.25 TRINITY_DN1162_c0_g1_i1:161-3148(+)
MGDPPVHEAGGRLCGGGWIIDSIEQHVRRQWEEQKARRAVTKRLHSQQLARQAHLDRMRDAASSAMHTFHAVQEPTPTREWQRPSPAEEPAAPRLTADDVRGSASEVASDRRSSRRLSSPQRLVSRRSVASPSLRPRKGQEPAADAADEARLGRLRAELQLEQVVRPRDQFKHASRQFRSAVRDATVRHIRGRAQLKELSSDCVSRLRRLGIDPFVLVTADLTAVEDVTVADVRFRSLAETSITVDTDSTMQQIAEHISLGDEVDRADFAELFLSADVRRFTRVVFWFCFAAFFQKADLPLFDDLLDAETPAQLRLFWKTTRCGQARTRFWEVYHYALAHTVCTAHMAAFRGSLKCFTSNWVDRVYVLVSLLLTGVFHSVQHCAAIRRRLFRAKQVALSVDSNPHPAAGPEKPEGGEGARKPECDGEDVADEPHQRRSGGPPPLAPDGSVLPGARGRAHFKPREVVLTHPDPFTAYEIGVYLPRGSMLDGVGVAEAAIESVQRNLPYNLRKERFRFGRFPVDLNLGQYDADFNIFNASIFDYDHAMSRFLVQRGREQGSRAADKPQPAARRGAGTTAIPSFQGAEYIRVNDVTGGMRSEVRSAKGRPTSAATAHTSSCDDRSALNDSGDGGGSRVAEPTSPCCDPHALTMCVKRVRRFASGSSAGESRPVSPDPLPGLTESQVVEQPKLRRPPPAKLPLSAATRRCTPAESAACASACVVAAHAVHSALFDLFADFGANEVAEEEEELVRDRMRNVETVLGAVAARKQGRRPPEQRPETPQPSPAAAAAAATPLRSTRASTPAEGSRPPASEGADFRRGASGVVTARTHLYHVSPLVAGTIGLPLEFRVSKKAATRTLTFGDETVDVRAEARQIHEAQEAAAQRRKVQEDAWLNSLVRRRNQLEQDIDRIEKAVGDTRNGPFERSELCDSIVRANAASSRLGDARRRQQPQTESFRGTLMADNAVAIAQLVDKSLRKLDRKLDRRIAGDARSGRR